MYTRQYGKSDLKRILQGMDFGKLEQTALQIGTGIHDSIVVRTPTARNDDQKEALAAMMKAMQANLSGRKADWYTMDDIYTPPKPHCMSQVHDIIDSFWSVPALGLYGQYIAQLDKKPKTKDVFKGKSTTHHYPWYRRGSKY